MTRCQSCVSGCDRSGTQESIVVFQLHLTHTANYWSRRHPLYPHTHTPAYQEGGHFSSSSPCLPEDKLVTELFMHAVFFRYHSVGTEAPAECWQTLLFRLFSSPSTSGYCYLQPLYLQQFRTPAGNNLHLSDKGESVGV